MLVARLKSCAVFLASCLTVSGSAVPKACLQAPTVTVLNVPVRVLSDQLRPVDSLQADNFSVTENGLSRALCHFSYEPEPASIGILLDVSGSMGADGGELLRLAIQGIDALLATSEPGDEYFLEYVDANASKQFKFTADEDQIRARLKTVAKGKTPLIDIIKAGLAGMKNARYPNRVLLVFSDAYENSSHRLVKQLEQVLSRSPVPVFLVVPVRQQPAAYATEEELESRRNIISIASRSGGYAIPVANAREMTSAVADLGVAIRSPYRLYIVSGEASITAPRSIRIALKQKRLLPLYKAMQLHQVSREP